MTKPLQLQVPRSIHSSPVKAAAAPRAKWPTRRVFTPWIDALTKSRQEGGQPPQPRPKPDLTPQKMSDTYYSAVRIMDFIYDS